MCAHVAWHIRPMVPTSFDVLTRCAHYTGPRTVLHSGMVLGGDSMLACGDMAPGLHCGP